MRRVIITLLSTVPLLGDTAVKQDTPQPFSKIEVMAWDGLQAQQNALNQKFREFFLEACKSHGIPVESCKPDTQNLTLQKVDASKVEPAKDAAK